MQHHQQATLQRHNPLRLGASKSRAAGRRSPLRVAAYVETSKGAQAPPPPKAANQVRWEAGGSQWQGMLGDAGRLPQPPPLAAVRPWCTRRLRGA